MNLVDLIHAISNRITRVKISPAGLIIEVDISNLPKQDIENIYQNIDETAWNNGREIVYSIYRYDEPGVLLPLTVLIHRVQVV